MEEEERALTPLNELLSAKDGAAKPEPAPEVETPSAPPPEAVKPPDPPPPAEPEAKTVPVQSYHAEKAKRQELETRLRELEARLAPPAPQQQPAKAPDVFDPDYGPSIDKRFADMEWKTRVSLSETAARLLHKDDYDEAIGLFREAFESKKVPGIPMDHPDPAGFAYEIGKMLALARDTGGDLSSYRSKLKAEIEAELKADAAKAEAAKRAAIMPTSAGDRSATPDKGAEGWEPKSLDTLLKAKNRR